MEAGGQLGGPCCTLGEMNMDWIWSDSGLILKEESTELPDRLDVGCETKRRVKGTPRCLAIF